MQERALAARLDEYLQGDGISTANARDCLQKQISRELYTRDANTHPLAEGYACYAEAAMTLLSDTNAS